MRVAALWLSACVPPLANPTSVEVAQGPPTIVSASLTCDAEDSVWTLLVITDAWTGGAVSHWTRDAVYIERHKFSSVSLAPDGGRDQLVLELGMVDDWREVSPGSSTSFTCGAGPAVLVWVDDPSGDDADCRSWGDPAIWSDVEGLAPCE